MAKKFKDLFVNGYLFVPVPFKNTKVSKPFYGFETSSSLFLLNWLILSIKVGGSILNARRCTYLTCFFAMFLCIIYKSS